MARRRLRSRHHQKASHRLAAVRIPRAHRAAVSRRVKELVREGYSPRYAAKVAYHEHWSEGGHARRSHRVGRDCVGIHTHANLGHMAHHVREGHESHEHDRDPRSSKMSWSTFAGGTGAHHGSSYSARGEFGEYHINPPSSRHGGYGLQWANTKSFEGHGGHGGLWHDLGTFRSPAAAKKAAKEHASRLTRGPYSRDPARRLRQHHLSAAERRHLRPAQFALPSRRALPIEDPRHVRNAAARLEQMRIRGTVTSGEYRAALARIRHAERHFGIHPRGR